MMKRASFLTFGYMDEKNAKALFYLLKEKVAEKYLSNHPTANKSIHLWTGNEIQGFQEDLSAELNERISERWFYTHIKPVKNEKLPRIDMLNILSRYVGYENWETFKSKNNSEVPNQSAKKKKEKNNWRWIWFIIPVLGIITVLWAAFGGKDQLNRYEFCFYDKDMGVPIADSTIELTLLNRGESPMKFYGNGSGCISIETENQFLRFVVKAPYFKTDTIERNLKPEMDKEIIELQRDDYALMILLFANSDVQDWEKRRNQLDGMISNDAVIFQITSDNTGMEMYNKAGFIDKLTTPLKSLGDIEIVETIYENDKIINLRFIQK